jgi:hypothetical protein
MPIIGTFSAVKDGYAGSIRTLTLSVRVRLIIAQWPADGGHYPAVAHEAAMATGLGLQLVAHGFFLTARRRGKPVAMAHAVARSLGGSPSRIVQPAYSSWTRQAEIARRQRAAWRLATAASVTLRLGLAATLSIAVSRPAVALHVIELHGPAAASN